MGYVERNLADGERIVYKTRLHRIIFVWPLLCLLLSGLAFISGFDVMGDFFLVLVCFTAFATLLPYLWSEFAVTNRRILGWLNAGKHGRDIDIPLLEIFEVGFKPGLLVRFFDYGSVVITDRQGHKQTLPAALPTEFYHQVEQRLARNQRILK